MEIPICIPDQDFRCFYPCKTILSLCSIPARGKDEMQPHVGRTSIRYVIVMLQLRYHVASQCIQDFLEAFFPE